MVCLGFEPEAAGLNLVNEKNDVRHRRIQWAMVVPLKFHNLYVFEERLTKRKSVGFENRYF